MKKQGLLLLFFLLFLSSKSYSQDFQITTPKLEFDGNQLQISYDVIDKNQADLFYVWVEIEKKNGEQIKPKAVSGDTGEKIKSGNNKKIIWKLADDSVFLNEEVQVQVKAEKYVKSFNKGSMMLWSLAIPGLGQTKISKGKPWWLTSVLAYGAVAGGLITHQSYLKTYDSYRIEEDPIKRSDLFSKTQKQMNLSSALIISGVAVWAANIIWVAAIPNNYRPLQHLQVSLDKTSGPVKGATVLTLRMNF
jgi:hypothetical protein